MVVLAAVTGAHGVAGEVRLKLFAESAASLKRHRRLYAGALELTLVSARAGPHGVIARFAEVADRTAAEALRGSELSVPRSALPPPAEGEIYVADLIGLPALADGAEVGRVRAVHDFGAGDLVDVVLASGREVLVPLSRCTIAADALTVDAAFLE
jgi:16S rRNA processing protein RimM